MKNEFAKKDKYILFFAFIFILVPAFQNTGINAAIMLCGLSVLFLFIQVVIKREVAIFKTSFSSLDWFMTALAGIGLIDAGLFILGTHSDSMRGFWVLAISAMYFSMRSEWELTKECMQVIFFAGVILIILSLLHFLMNTDIILKIGMRDIGLIEEAALFIGLIGVYNFSLETNKIMNRLYAIGIVGCMVCLSLCGNDIALLLFVLGICLLIVNAERERVQLRKLLFCFFLSLFIPCNIVLLVNYTSFIHVEVSVWSLQASVVGELLLSIIAVFVCDYWDKIEEKQEDAMKNMQVFFKMVFRYIGFFGLLLLVIGVAEIRIGVENILKLFHDSGWTPEGVFISTFLEISARMGENIVTACNENALWLVYDAYGMIGVLFFVVLFVIFANRLWEVSKCTRKKDVLTWMLSVGILVGYVLLPMRPIMIPIDTFILMKTVHGNAVKKNER